MDTYSIRQLLQNNILIIPEIQREYVWGNNVKVLTSFLNDINDNIVDADKNIGFLYSYSVHGKEHYIIDGQQRLTTIVLLLYVKSLQDPHNYELFKTLLHTDASTMSFSYNVRPLTEQFLRQLFKQQCINSVDIHKQKWFMHEYASDITIMSIMGALDVMSKKGAFSNLTFEKILDNINFWYFNVNETSQGEELYITMNSRGQKLTQSEQLKPRLFGKLSTEQINVYGKLWDDWEEYFYTNRPKEGKLHVMKYVDMAMNNFIRVVSELIVCKESNEIQDIPELSLSVLGQWFEALKLIPQEEVFQREIKRLYETNEDKNFMVLKALLATAMRKPEDIREYSRVRAIMRNNVIRRSAVEKHTELLSLLKAYINTPQLSFYEFLLSGINTQDVLADNELQKIKILQEANSIEIEEAFWYEEHHCIWNGDIHPLIKWATNEVGKFEFSAYQRYERLFNIIFPFKDNELRENAKLDLIRRALLSQKFPNYPGYYRSGTNCSFAYEPSDWKKVCNHIQNMKAFLDRLNATDNWEDEAKLMIAEYEAGNDYYEFVHDKRLLKYCHQKNIQWWWKTVYLIQKERASGAHANIHAYKYFLQSKERDFDYWEMRFYEFGITCVYFDQKKEGAHIAIDLYWNSGKNHDMMEIDCFMRHEADLSRVQQYLSPLADTLKYQWNGERYILQLVTPQDEYESFVMMDENLKALMDKIVELSL